MKVFLISNMYPSIEDKLFGVFIKNFKKELESQNVVFSKTALIKGRTNNLFKKGYNYFIHYLKIIFNLFSFKYDLVYIHYVSHHVPILFLLLPFKSKPWVLNAHGNDIISLQKSVLLNYFAKKVLKKVDLLVVPTDYFKQKVLDYYPFLNKKRIYISPSGGVDSNKFYVKVKKASNLIFTLGFVSRFVEEKGWKTFLEAIVVLKKRNLSFKAIIAGRGTDEKNIKEYILKNDISDKVEFLGFINQEKLVNLYNRLDLYIFPTYCDALGLTGVEAMACGVPVISCDIAGPSTYVDHEKNGYLFAPKNYKILAELIIKYHNLSNKEKIDFSKNAVKTASRFEQTEVGKRLVKKLNDLI